MYKLWATIQKDIRLFLRDKVGLILMFGMPIILAILIAAIQNNTFKLVNDNKVSIVIYNNDGGKVSQQFLKAINDGGMFTISVFNEQTAENKVLETMKEHDALVTIVIPNKFSIELETKAKHLSTLIFKDMGLEQDSGINETMQLDPITIYYSPILQSSFRESINGAIRASLQLVENKLLIKNLYEFTDSKSTDSKLEETIANNQISIQEITAARNGSRNIPNATQHNIPAWTIFAMFFVVVSLGSSVVKEKLNGSFIRLKTLPSSILISLFSKQITYLFVALLQVVVIFSIGVYLFPLMGLPQLNLPFDILALFFVSFVCGACAVSYAICVGVFASTQEQANGIGAVSIVMLSAIGGLLVPSFAMPDSFQIIMKLSPLHWCLESYYGLFLEGGNLRDILSNILPLVLITILFQLLSLWGLKRKKLI